MKPRGPQLALMLQEAIRCHQDGRTAKAERLYRDILAADPSNLDAVHLTGVLAAQRKDYAKAAEFIGRAVQLAPHIPQIHANLGKAYYGLEQIEKARESFETAVRLAPGLGDAWNDLGNTQRDLGRLEQAMASFDKALQINPNAPEPWANRADVLVDLRDFPVAETSLQRALALNPQFAEAYQIRAQLWLARGEATMALADADRSLALRPGFGNALAARAEALERLGRTEEAGAARLAAVGHDPQILARLLGKGKAASEQALRETAVDYLARAVALAPGDVAANGQLAVELMLLKRLDEARAAADRTLALDPNDGLGQYVKGQVALQTCDWDRQAEALAYMRGLVERREISLALSAFTFMNFDTSAAEQLVCARMSGEQAGASEIETPVFTSSTAERIRIAYLSADYHSHATAWLLAGLIERHDRARFEVIGLSNGPGIRDEMRERLIKAFDRFVDIRELDDAEAFNLIRGLDLDILIDLKGYTQGHRAGLLSLRPAPVQAQWLGYPGTMGAPFIDYLIADPSLIPPEDEGFYSECVARLPDSYQVNDNTRPISAATPTRGEAGLPAEGFVFCSFNSSYKITRPVFDVWMRLLSAVPGSVLWLLGDNLCGIETLQREAAARGVDPARLIFADRAPQAEHLARQRLGDLFLDTTPVNAHTTASDALWAGLPVVTVRGRTFIGRVAESVLVADGLPELVAADLAAYEALALDLARDPARLAAVRAKVAANRDTAALFDTDRFRRHIEAAYETMHARRQDGLAPEPFDVPP